MRPNINDANKKEKTFYLHLNVSLVLHEVMKTLCDISHHNCGRCCLNVLYSSSQI